MSVIVVTMRALTSSLFLGLPSRQRRRCALAVALHQRDSGLGISHAQKLRTLGLHEIFKCSHLKFTVYGRKHTDIHTHNFRKCSYASVGLAQARPNKFKTPHVVDVSIHALGSLQHFRYTFSLS